MSPRTWRSDGWLAVSEFAIGARPGVPLEPAREPDRQREIAADVVHRVARDRAAAGLGSSREARRAEEVPGEVLGHEREVELTRRELLRVLQVEETDAAREGRRLVDRAIALASSCASARLPRERRRRLGPGGDLACRGGASPGGVYLAGCRQARRAARGSGGRRSCGARGGRWGRSGGSPPERALPRRGREPSRSGLCLRARGDEQNDAQPGERREGEQPARSDRRSLEHV